MEREGISIILTLFFGDFCQYLEIFITKIIPILGLNESSFHKLNNFTNSINLNLQVKPQKPEMSILCVNFEFCGFPGSGRPFRVPRIASRRIRFSLYKPGEREHVKRNIGRNHRKGFEPHWGDFAVGRAAGRRVRRPAD